MSTYPVDIKSTTASTVPTQTATVQAKPTNSVRLGFIYQPADSELGVTANQYRLFLNGNPVGIQAATTVPDDIALEANMMVWLVEKG